MPRKKKQEPRRVMVNMTGEEFTVLLEAQKQDNVPRSLSTLCREAIVGYYGAR